MPYSNREFPVERHVGSEIDVGLVGRSSAESVTIVPLGRGGHPGDCTRVTMRCGSNANGGDRDSYGAAGSVDRAFVGNSSLSKNAVAVVGQLMLSTNQRPSMSLVVIVCEN